MMKKQLPLNNKDQPVTNEEDTVLSLSTPKLDKETEKLQQWLEGQIQIAYRTVKENVLIIYITVPSNMGNTIEVPKEGTKDENVIWEIKKFNDTDRIIYRCPEQVSSIEESRNLVASFIILYQTKYILMAKMTPINNHIH
jgi:hypothetical protein